VVGGFGGYLPLTKGSFAPYAGAGLRYAWTDYGHNASHGFQPYAAAGVLLGRLSSVALRGQFEWWWNTFTNDGKTANGATWNLGVQF
jgi:outer membrane protein W